MTETSIRDPADDDTGVAPAGESTTGTRRWHKVVGIIGLVVATWVGSEMYDVLYGDIGGGGPDGGHGSGQEAPVENQDQEIDTDDGDDEPSQGGHG